MVRRIGLTLLVLFLALPVHAETTHLPLIFCPTTAGPAPKVSIVEMQYSGRDEYVAVHNYGLATQPMAGWRLHSVSGDQWYAFPDGYSLAPDTIVRVHSGRDAVDDPPGDLLWHRGYVWNNDGDQAELYDASGRLVDLWSYSGPVFTRPGRCDLTALGQ